MEGYFRNLYIVYLPNSITVVITPMTNRKCMSYTENCLTMISVIPKQDTKPHV